uniref:uncharacterized protein LOC120341238 isoform X3 n=1 Tax=Styela clava TaxID=7725 RepID=UPI0019395DEF|nr:uncharacterized protein LOC120341238 isoform X3 [Styela clava]
MSSSMNLHHHNNMESSTDGNGNESNTDDICAQKSTATYQIFWIIIIVIILLCNTFILAAMAKGWGVLRQNVVHRYLISCLLSVMSFCLVSAYEMLHTLYGVDEYTLGESVLRRYDDSNPIHRSVMQGYAYRKGLLPVLAIVMQFNIAVLIYGVSDNTYFVGRFTNPEVLSRDHINTRMKNNREIAFLLDSKKWRKHKPVLMCVFSWVAPLGISIPVAFGWSCVEHCACLPTYRWRSTCIPRRISQENDFEWTSRSFRDAKINDLAKTTRSASMQVLKSPQSTPTNSIKIETTHSQSSARPRPFDPSFRPRRSKRPPLDPTVKLLIILSISLFLSVTPIMMIWLLDVITTADVSKGYGFSVALSLSYIYSASLPLILLKYMSGLKQACISFFIKCPCTGTTVVTQTNGVVSPRPEQSVAGTTHPNVGRHDENNIFSLGAHENINETAS